ncbi:hypothetical protein [Flavobacterium sandaracinum]|uniref:Uncharacterized protein n=1 Tax=Flavobacterium sandaracinum TaxID=2541733 RepID=A0A4R5D5P5_9FLAO|nr:hypothetical protein [Flavobacterium sandaracinum]TDE05735.1 hypothetical protein E0F91_05950 [Flavobacterium sandaracinum]
MIPLLLSSNAFLARMLDNENAETFGPSDCAILLFVAGLATGIDGTVVLVSSSFIGTDSITCIAGFGSSIVG